MHPVIEKRLVALEQFLAANGLAIFDQKEIQHGHSVTVTDGTYRVPISLYQTGKVLVQGKANPLRDRLNEWKSEVERSGLAGSAATATSGERLDRQTKFLVIPKNIEAIRHLVLTFDGDVTLADPKGAAELYRADVRRDNYRVSLTQYGSGTLLVQGRTSPLFDAVCEYLDRHLTQSFSERAARYLPEEARTAQTDAYLAGEAAENEAVAWLHTQLEREVWNFLFLNDQQTLVSAAGVRNAVKKTGEPLPDFAAIVVPFGKAFEGFMVRLAIHLKLVAESEIERAVDEIRIRGWIEQIGKRLPDATRYGDLYSSLKDAWDTRNKSVHSDPKRPNALRRFVEAEHEIIVILRGMSRAHRGFVQEQVALLPESPPSEVKPDNRPQKISLKTGEYRFEYVDRERLKTQLQADGYILTTKRGHSWAILDKPRLQVFAPLNSASLIQIVGEQAADFSERYHQLLTVESSPPVEEATPATPLLILPKRIGVDESGKGDFFGPLVVAAVALDAVGEETLGRVGVRDSKKLRDPQIEALAEVVQQHATIELLILSPPDYNAQYEKHGNLNRLLAECHAQVIQTLSERTGARRALSDQFGKVELLKDALVKMDCHIELEQRPGAEDDVAVAAASIVARAAFIKAIQQYSSKAGMEIPLGASDPRVKQVGLDIYRRWGREGLSRITKLHFKFTEEITGGI